MINQTQDKTIEDPMEAAVLPASWERARQILFGIKQHLRLSIAGQALLGMELLALKKELGFLGGGRKKNSDIVSELPKKSWELWVSDELTITSRTADRMIDCYEAVRLRLKKLSGMPALIGILAKAPADLCAIERQTLEAAVSSVTDGCYQKELLEELRLVKRHDNGIGGDTSQFPPHKKDMGQIVFAFFSDFSKGLRRICTNPDRQAYFEILASEKPIELQDMEISLETALAEIKVARAKRTTGIVVK